MNPLSFATILVRFIALECWLAALVCCVFQLVDWCQIRSMALDMLHDKYYVVVPVGSHWLLAAFVLALLGLAAYAGVRPLARFLSR